MPIQVPFLNEKIKLLMSSARRPEIKTQKDLAVCLDITYSYLDKILNNRCSEYDNAKPNTIAENQVKKLTKCFYLREETLMVSDLSAFKRHINDADQVLNDLLWDAEADVDAIALTTPAQWQRRGVRPALIVNNTEGYVYAIGDKFRVKLMGPLGWSTVLLCKDPDDWYVLSASTPIETAINKTHGCVETVMYSFEPPIGQHYLLAIMSTKPLADAVINLINSSIAPNQREKAVYCLGHVLSDCDPDQKLLVHLPFSLRANAAMTTELS